ncbi:hypothetical protein MKX08_001944 [Trichoderma sp. CBMAI-0020]|nr:hypothetical protein MKX08_001944 [Trichoderma sp. CBMAI-0020]
MFPQLLLSDAGLFASPPRTNSSFGPDGARHNPRYAVAVRDPQILQEAQELGRRGILRRCAAGSG